MASFARLLFAAQGVSLRLDEARLALRQGVSRGCKLVFAALEQRRDLLGATSGVGLFLRDRGHLLVGFLQLAVALGQRDQRGLGPLFGRFPTLLGLGSLLVSLTRLGQR